VDLNIPALGYGPEENVVISGFTEWCNHNVTKNKIKASFKGILAFLH
tara:strand:+ start:277 stop:417 length:141 start_codon:yes stop_codon:yes gene_type:complete